MKEEYLNKLTLAQRAVLANQGTEPPFSGELLHNKEQGTYHCAACGAELFNSETKYDSGSGWPSFYQVIKDKVEARLDLSQDMQRTEVVCKNCGGHLGHVFDDGPRDKTGQRYCINSRALNFKK